MGTMKNVFLLVVFALLAGLAACDRPEPAEVPERAAEVAPHTTDGFIGEDDYRLILVTGATGTQGGAVARELLERGYAVRGLTRDPQSEDAQALADLGAEMVAGNYDNAASLAAAMEGVHGVFAVTLFWQYGYEAEVEQGKRLIDEAAKAGVGHFVLTSVAGADDKTGIPHFESKWEIEQYLHESDLNWSIVRPVEFMDNWNWQMENYAQGRLIDPRAPDSDHQWIAASDIGHFVGEAFDHPDSWIGTTREIAGDQLTIGALRETLAEVFDHEFEHIRPSWEEFEAQVGEEVAIMVKWFDEEGYDVDIEALRETHPGLVTAREFLQGMAAKKGSD